MIFFATAIFFTSLFGIVALFGVKYLEQRHERIFVPAIVREKVDERALQLKVLLAESRVEFSKLPPKMLVLLRFFIHVMALKTAALARALEVQAHRLADAVSHKHKFEKRETRSEFLKKVSKYKKKTLPDASEKDPADLPR